MHFELALLSSTFWSTLAFDVLNRTIISNMRVGLLNTILINLDSRPWLSQWSHPSRDVYSFLTSGGWHLICGKPISSLFRFQHLYLIQIHYLFFKYRKTITRLLSFYMFFILYRIITVILYKRLNEKLCKHTLKHRRCLY